MNQILTTIGTVGISTAGGILVTALVFFGLAHSNAGGIAASMHNIPSNALNFDDPLNGSSVVAIRSGEALLDSALGVPSKKQKNPGLPVRLKIPVINVDSAVEFVGLTSDGVMGVPKNRDDVAWLKLGLRPGARGSAVIAGHFGVRDGKGSVFDSLHTLKKGDILTVEDDLGANISFAVREIRRYDPSSDAAAVFDSSGSESHLNLITCEGVWDNALNGYPARLVVFTDKIDS